MGILIWTVHFGILITGDSNPPAMIPTMVSKFFMHFDTALIFP